MIPPAFIEDVIARTDIVDVIEPHVVLKKSGANFSGLCPFHQEKSPSFSVSQDKQFYYCFGCHASGSALKFLMEFERLSFPEAVERLAHRLGLEVPQSEGGEDASRKRRRQLIFDQLEAAKSFYKHQLRSHPEKERAVAYLKGRGLTGEIAARYELGYAPPGWNHLLVDDEPETRSLLLEAGLLVRKEDETGHYDRFRDRIMFPIRDLRGRTIAFGGRVLGDAKPKYLNSPETPLFHKGRELYGLYEARRATNRLSRLIIVEGYLDVVALAQFGVTFAVATLGTATTDEHLGRLFRQVSDLVFCFDGDRAGQAAAGKALLLLLPHLEDGRRATFMFLPEGDDPDSVVRREGKEGFLDRVKAGLDVSAWLFEKLSGDLKSAGHDLASIAGKAALAKEAVKWISTMPAGAFKQLMLEEVTAKTGVAQQRLDQIAETLPVAQAVRPIDQSVETRSSAEVEARPGRGDDQRATVDTDLALLVLHPELAEDLDADVILGLGQEGADGVLRLVCENIRAEGLKTPGQLMGHFASSPLAKSLKLAFDYTPVLDVSFLKSEFVERLRRRASRADHRRRQAEMAELIHRVPSSLSEEERQRLRQFYGQQKADQ
jgi:DNA primase